MRVPADAVAGEVGVRQEAPLAVEGRAVAVETLGEGEHDVGELVHLVADLAVRDLPEGESVCVCVCVGVCVCVCVRVCACVGVLVGFYDIKQ